MRALKHIEDPRYQDLAGKISRELQDWLDRNGRTDDLNDIALDAIAAVACNTTIAMADAPQEFARRYIGAVNDVKEMLKETGNVRTR